MLVFLKLNSTTYLLNIESISFSGSASERLERHVFKPKAPVKGVSQSKLILMKKTKTGKLLTNRL